MAFAESAAEFVDTDDFAVSATLDGNAVSVILDQAYSEVQDVESSHPVVVGKYSELSLAAHGQALVIGSDNYSVVGVEHDGQEVMTMLVLKSTD